MLPAAPSARAQRATALCALAFTFASAQGCASMSFNGLEDLRRIDWKHQTRSWAERGLGSLLAFALHESCHLALGAAFGAEIDAEMRPAGPHLLFGRLSDAEHRAVAIAGNACTGLAAEIVVDTGLHRKSDIAWGAAAFHAVNAFGYAFSKHGDAEHWQSFGGGETAWQAMNAAHASRIGAHLAWDAGIGTRVIRWWRGPEQAPLPRLPGSSWPVLPGSPESVQPPGPWSRNDAASPVEAAGLIRAAPMTPGDGFFAPATAAPPWAAVSRAEAEADALASTRR